MYNPKYSIILYYEELLEEDIEYIYEYLKKGIVVHLFLKGSFSEELSLNEYGEEDFNVAKENKLLYVYDEQDNMADDNVVIAVDGNILNHSIYEIISKDRGCNFNHHQYDIITAPTNSNIIVVSGAGTGKTTTMINRLVYLRKVMTDFTFDQAVLITFTNKASIEMKERLLEVLNRYFKVTKDPLYLELMEEGARCSVSTIHKFSKKLLNKYGKFIRINKDIQVRSFKFQRQEAIIEALNRVYNERRELYDIVKYYPIYELESKLLAVWDKLDNYSIDLNSNKYDMDFGEDESSFTELLSIVLRTAQIILDENKDNQLEISDLMKKLSHDNLFEGVQKDYKVIMVDEFQDSDNIQIEFVCELCKKMNANLLVVGDEKQSIYRFRGAEYTAFDKLKELLKDSKKQLKEYKMIRNYRTNSNLLEEINNIFIDVDKKVECFNYKEKDYIYSNVDQNIKTKIDNIDFLGYEDKAEFYSSLLNKKNDNEAISVLFRSNNDIKEFKEFCDRHNILCRVDASGGFYRHEAVRDFYVMIKSLISERDTKTMYSFIETPYINKAIDKKIILEGSEKEKNDFLYSVLQEAGWSAKRGAITYKNPLVLIDEIITELKPIRNYYQEVLISAKRNQEKYKDIAYIKALEYKLNLEHLIFLIKEEFSENITSLYQIEQFLKIKISTDNKVDIRKPGKFENNYIQCLTVHKAKGLEFDYVILDKLTNRFLSNSHKVEVILKPINNVVKVGYRIILGDEEFKNGIYSQYLKDEKEEIKGEEARLLYVALTRCKKKLYLNMSGEHAATGGINTWKSLVGGAISYV